MEKRKYDDFRDLEVWKRCRDIRKKVWDLCKGFPSEEKYRLSDQMIRASRSSTACIAEGYGRNSTNDYIHFLRIASGSLYELQTQMEISLNLQYIDRREFENLYELSREIERMLSSLIRKLREK